jgi:carbon starvation protein
MNIPTPPGANLDGSLPPAVAAQLTERISAYGPAFHVTPDQMTELAAQVEERSLYNRAGGGPSLAVGMAHIFSKSMRGSWLAFWYHFAIMFEAVFILTVVDSGTRVIRFVVQELAHDLALIRGRSAASVGQVPIWRSSVLAVLGWGAILSWGIVDREGGTKALIKMFGTANQFLAVIALALATVIMLRRHRRYAWITGLPMLVVGAVTLTAAYQAILSSDPRVGAVALARAAASATAVHNAWLTAILTGVLGVSVLTVLALSLRRAATLVRTREEGT